MSALADDAFDNFKYRIEATAPDKDIIRANFKYVDERDLDIPSVAPDRKFNVNWEGSEGPDDFEDDTEQQALHTFTVDVYYNSGQSGRGRRQLTKALLRDRHELIETLRDTDKYNGVDDDGDRDTGIKSRIVSGAERIKVSDSIMALRLTCICDIFELEE